MRKQQALRNFIDMHEKPWGDYWTMQECWACYVDGLHRDGEITDKQAFEWPNPCTPETFDKWNTKWYGKRNCG